MIDPADFFRRRAIVTLASELPKETQNRLREKIKAEGMTIAEQLSLLESEAMKSYKEPEFLRDRAVLLEVQSGGARAEFRARHGKSAAAGEA